MLSTRDPFQCFFFFQLCRAACAILVPRPGIEPAPPALEAHSLNHWTAREVPDKTAFKIKTVTRDKEGHYIMIKGSIQEEDIAIINIYAPNTGAPRYIRQMLTDVKREIDSKQ